LNKILAKGPVSPKGPPRLYIKTIAELEDFLNESLQKEKDAKEKDAKKKMNAIQAKAMVTMKQKIRKNNRLYEDQIAKWREVCLIVYSIITIHTCIYKSDYIFVSSVNAESR